MKQTQFVVWKDDYLVGHPELDAHHRRMLSLLNDLYKALVTDQECLRGPALLKSASDYAEMHFRAEESILRAAHYAALADQEKAHNAYSRRMKALVRKSHEDLAEAGAELLEFLRDWWLNHILKMDRAYSAHLKARRNRA